MFFAARPAMRTPYLLTAALAALMAVQSALGVLFQGQYRDPEWIRAAWFGNDWVTLVVAVPLLLVCCKGVTLSSRVHAATARAKTVAGVRPLTDSRDAVSS